MLRKVLLLLELQEALSSYCSEALLEHREVNGRILKTNLS